MSHMVPPVEGDLWLAIEMSGVIHSKPNVSQAKYDNSPTESLQLFKSLKSFAMFFWNF